MFRMIFSYKVALTTRRFGSRRVDALWLNDSLKTYCRISSIKGENKELKRLYYVRIYYIYKRAH
jgi:hypothetical protein